MANIIACGSDFLIFVEEGSGEDKTFKAIGGQTSAEISDDNDQRETTTKLDRNGANYEYGRERWSVSVDLERIDEKDPDNSVIKFELLEDWKKEHVKPTIVGAWITKEGEVDKTRRIYRGQAMVKLSSSFPNGENATGSLSLQGIGELEHIKP
ncbi:phage tail protein [Halosquirtibacter xylanolyticus]|uniref:phage tail tube protein n=1 Tax=Halosquirtibacter xylanolyticus TaxID=3374599 RepID=UPI00374A4B33|nr:phage tail protein [Prolixibacteraceae bacterium]